MDKHFPPDSYVGLTENSFKDRYTKHKSSFKTRNPKNASGLSRYVWNLEDEKIDFEIKWKIISRAKAYDPGSGVCRLCVREKYFIIFKPNMWTINCRNEVAMSAQGKQIDRESLKPIKWLENSLFIYVNPGRSDYGNL